MKKTTLALGLLFAVSVAVYILTDDLAIRIAALVTGAVSFVGALISGIRVYKSSAGYDGENASEKDTENADTDSSETGPSAESQPAAMPFEPPDKFRTSRVQLPDDIPEAYYRFDQTALPMDDPTDEFNFAVQYILRALKDHVMAHTAALFWINTDRQQIVVCEHVTDSRYFTTARRLPLGEDPVSRIGQSGKPIVLSTVAEKSVHDMIVYYDQRAGVRSFAGIPLFFMDAPIAVLAVDSIALDAFGIETVAAMGKFAAVLTLLITSYDQKFDLRSDSKLLAVLDEMRQSMQSALDTYGISSAVADATSRLLDWDYIAVILYNTEKQNWIISRSLSKVPNLPYVSEGVTVDMDRSVLRKVLQAQEGRIFNAPQAPECRFQEKEVVTSHGQICAAPIFTTRKCAGLMMVENREAAHYGNRDLEKLTRISDLAGLFLDISSTRDLLRKHLSIDEPTQTASRNFLMLRLQEEHYRIRRHGGDAVFMLAGVDNPDELAAQYGQEGLDTILAQLARLIRSSLQPYDVIGRYESSRLGLLLLHTNAEDAYLRGEKLRKAAAGLVLSQGGISFSVTASIAGCALTADSEVEQVLRVVRQAMDLAVGEGGNCVKVV